MKGKCSRLTKLLAVMFTVSISAVMLTGCGKNAAQQELAPNQEFVFTGQMKAENGRTLDLKVTGDNTDNSLLMTVDQMQAMSLTGHYEKVDGKGYKLYFNDISNSFTYSQYDPETRNMTFQTLVNMGNYGKEKVEFTFHDEAFADEYDGVGLGKTPPVFDMEGWAGGVVQTFGTLACNEDGSVSVNDDWASPREGTWEYDEANNVYTITFTEKSFVGLDSYPWKQGHVDRDKAPVLTQADIEANNYFMGPYTTNYDEKTSTYSMTIELSWSINEKHNEVTEYVCTYTE